MGLPLAGKKVGVLINYLGEARPERYCRISSFLSFAKPCGLEEAGEEGRWWILWGKREKQWWLHCQWCTRFYWFNSIQLLAPSKADQWCGRGLQWGTRPGRDVGTHTQRHRLPSNMRIVMTIMMPELILDAIVCRMIYDYISYILHWPPLPILPNRWIWRQKCVNWQHLVT